MNENPPPRPEQPVEPEQPAQPEQIAQPEQPAQAVQLDGLPPEPSPHPARRRRRVVPVIGCAVLLAALVGGTGFTVVTVRDADRDPGAPVWRLPKAAADGEHPAEARGLKALLLPYGTSENVRGQDLGEFGADAELNGAQATALRKESLRSLPRSQRRRLEKEIDKQHIQGMAMRSYVSTATNQGWQPAKDAFTVEIVLSRMDRRSARSIVAFQQQFLDALKVFRAGPKIEGHRNAKCFLPPAGSKDKLDVMVCSAYEGDILVSATMNAVKPLDTKAAARLLRDQLDRIKDPGKAV
ncbi:hypothetical protein [Streptomyces sp. NRRL S-813]|uniref:hypothetical protein n=1 Tax=Streptomyces sp. NRRL S-813 TaxID=1463919 RepID=UPI0004BE875F|nr:hypothetical protein [Streptomyces sp. NRRL S-813]